MAYPTTAIRLVFLLALHPACRVVASRLRAGSNSAGGSNSASDLPVTEAMGSCTLTPAETSAAAAAAAPPAPTFAVDESSDPSVSVATMSGQRFALSAFTGRNQGGAEKRLKTVRELKQELIDPNGNHKLHCTEDLDTLGDDDTTPVAKGSASVPVGDVDRLHLYIAGSEQELLDHQSLPLEMHKDGEEMHAKNAPAGPAQQQLFLLIDEPRLNSAEARRGPPSFATMRAEAAKAHWYALLVALCRVLEAAKAAGTQDALEALTQGLRELQVAAQRLIEAPWVAVVGNNDEGAGNDEGCAGNGGCAGNAGGAAHAPACALEQTAARTTDCHVLRARGAVHSDLLRKSAVNNTSVSGVAVFGAPRLTNAEIDNVILSLSMLLFADDDVMLPTADSEDSLDFLGSMLEGAGAISRESVEKSLVYYGSTWTEHADVMEGAFDEAGGGCCSSDSNEEARKTPMQRLIEANSDIWFETTKEQKEAREGTWRFENMMLLDMDEVPPTTPQQRRYNAQKTNKTKRLLFDQPKVFSAPHKKYCVRAAESCDGCSKDFVTELYGSLAFHERVSSGETTGPTGANFARVAAEGDWMVLRGLPLPGYSCADRADRAWTGGPVGGFIDVESLVHRRRNTELGNMHPFCCGVGGVGTGSGDGGARVAGVLPATLKRYGVAVEGSLAVEEGKIALGENETPARALAALKAELVRYSAWPARKRAVEALLADTCADASCTGRDHSVSGAMTSAEQPFNPSIGTCVEPGASYTYRYAHARPDSRSDSVGDELVERRRRAHRDYAPVGTGM